MTDFGGANSKALYCLNDAIITPNVWNSATNALSGGVYDQHGKLCRPAERSRVMSMIKLINPETIDPTEACDEISGTCIYLGHYTHHYGHFLLETLARFWPLTLDHDYDKYIFHTLFNRTTYSPAYSPANISFASFGIDSDKVLVTRNKIRVEQLLVPSRMISINDEADSEQANVYRNIVSYCQQQSAGSEATFPSRIYVSRRKLCTRGSQSRFLVNESEVEQLFAAFGFTIIYPEELAFEKQVLMFHAAELTAGVSGSAMHNSVFMQERARAITLGVPREPNAPHINQTICDGLSNVQAEFIPFQGRMVDDNRGAFEFDIQYLTKALAKLLTPTKSTPFNQVRAPKPKSPDQRQAVICILGMHRSGTSSLAGAIERAGAFAGDVERISPCQHRGSRENHRMVFLNDALLAANNGSWYDPPNDLSWSPQRAYERDRNVAEMGRQSPVWMFKDPRTLLTLPFWQEGVEQLHFVGTFRHPMNVALSLYQRQLIPIRKGFDLWIHYNRLLLQAFRHSPFPILCFDLPTEAYLSQLSQAIEQLNNQLDGLASLSPAQARAFYTADAVHQRNYEALLTETWCGQEYEADKTRIATVKELYQELRQAAGISNSPARSTAPTYYVPLEDTAAAYQQTLQTHGQNAQVLVMLGDAQSKAENTAAAIASYRQSLAIEPEKTDVQKKLAALLVKDGQVEAATDMLGKILLALPEDVDAHIQLIILLDQQGQHRRALELCKQALQLDPGRLHLYMLQGRTQRQLGDLEAAINSYRQALVVDSSKAHLHAALADVLIKFGQVEESKTICDHALTLDPHSPDAHRCLGDIHRVEGNEESAIACYRKALQLAPDRLGTMITLGAVLMRRGQSTDAHEVFQWAHRLQPKNQLVQRTLNELDKQINRQNRGHMGQNRSQSRVA